MRKNQIQVVLGMFLAFIMVGCEEEKSQQVVTLRSDFVPLKVMMTDYVIAEDGAKLFKIEGSVQLIVPLADCDIKREGNTIEYSKVPRPKVDNLSARIDKQTLILNERGLFTSRTADSKKINEIRKEAAEEMKKLAGSDTFAQLAMKDTEQALRAFYGDNYKCSVKWTSK